LTLNDLQTLFISLAEVSADFWSRGFSLIANTKMDFEYTSGQCGSHWSCFLRKLSACPIEGENSLLAGKTRSVGLYILNFSHLTNFLPLVISIIANISVYEPMDKTRFYNEKVPLSHFLPSPLPETSSLLEDLNITDIDPFAAVGASLNSEKDDK